MIFNTFYIVGEVEDVLKVVSIKIKNLVSSWMMEAPFLNQNVPKLTKLHVVYARLHGRLGCPLTSKKLIY